ncbi:MAG: type 1 glutamine amidotransferase [FCB group bacterium]|nr:type 1 glutamine amidotransferase [FCB group bacterium]
MKHVILICAGQTPRPIAEKFGEKLEWYRSRTAGLGVELEPRLVYQGDCPDCSEGDAWIITGSGESVPDHSEWMLQLEELIRCGTSEGKPILGICFGHQIIAQALGGKVIRNPKGWEVGSHTIHLTAAGTTSAIFKGFPPDPTVYETHEDIVERLPENAELLAKNQMGIQAFSYADNVYAVQFHPEFTYEIICEYTKMRELQGIPVNCGRVARANAASNVIANFIKTIF